MSTHSLAHDEKFTVSLEASVVPLTQLLIDEYQSTWGICCVVADADGQIHSGKMACMEDCAGGQECAGARRRAIAESARWGEPSVTLCPQGIVIWAVPMMVNSQLLGGLVAATHDTSTPGVSDGVVLSPRDIRRAANDLLSLAEESNLTNAALMELRRMTARRESERAEAIHELKDHNYQSIREIYLVEEPALIAAIKSGDRAAAREIINRVLVGIYFMGRDRPMLLKSFILELVVMMSRSAVEAGGDPAELLGANYSSFGELARMSNEEEICTWLVSMLERIMDAIRSHHHYPISVLLGAAMKYMQEHLQEDISRDDVARVACLSPTHFSRVVKQTFGQSFTELLAKLRVDKAREMLVLTEKSLLQICLDCGFNDQSYFTKVFQKITGRTPGEYRKLHRSSL